MNDTTIIDMLNIPPEIDAAVTLVTNYFAKLSPDGKWQYRGLAARSLVIDNDWQPIATAPKDGTMVLVYSAAWGEVGVAYCHGTWCWQHDEVGEIINEITHWMPLPKPPQVTP